MHTVHSFQRWLIVAVLCAVALAYGSRPVQAQTFARDGKLYQLRASGSTSELHRINRTTSPYTSTVIASVGTVINALGYNSQDDFMYAVTEVSASPTRPNLYRLSTTGITNLGAITGLPFGTYYAGTFDEAGNYYVGRDNFNTIYRINISTLAVTPLTLTATIPIGDFAINPADGLLYGASYNSATLYTIDINAAGNKTVTTRAITGASANTFGSVFFDPAGEFYAYENGGTFYRINLATGAATNVSTAASVSRSDGAVSPFTVEAIDVVKSAGPISAVNATTYDVTFTTTLANTGPATASNVQITESLSRAFVSGSPTLSIQSAPTVIAGTALTTNAAFNGTTDTRLLAGTQSLAIGAQTTVRFVVRAVYASAAVVPVTQSNTVYASSVSTSPNAGHTFPGGNPLPPIDVVAVDESTSGGTPPATSNSDTPTPTVFALAGSISGRVFEDVNYGGGAGRPITTGGAVGVNGVRVELYKPDGTFSTFTTTATVGGLAGSYTLPAPPATGYTVRVVNSTVQSTRPGTVNTLVGVQTYRVQSGADDVNRVGGEVPSATDAGNGASGTSITAAGVLSTGGQAQSIATANSVAAGTTGVNFGFNFDTVVNTNSSGQGSLAQFITNASTLGNTGLAQTGRTAGEESSIFMISNGVVHLGLRAGLPDLLTGGVAVINVASALPAITGANADRTLIDGTTQTANVGNTNALTLGTGGTVGTAATALPTVAAPEVQIQDGGGFTIGLDVQATNVTVKGVAVVGFGNTTNNDAHANVRVGSSGTNALITGNILGATATSFAFPAGLGSGGDNIRAIGATGGTISNNLIGYAEGKGIGLQSGANNWSVTGNEVRGNGINHNTLDGLDIESSSGATVNGNLFVDNVGAGIDSLNSTGANTFTNNTSTGNGRGNGETPGVRIYGTGNVVNFNVINNNYGAGILVQPAATASISRNSIYDNGEVTTSGGGAASGQIGIDLMAAGNDAAKGTSPFVTSNDSGDGDAGGNGLLNFPFFESAQITGGNLVLKGWSRPGAAIELFIANPDPTGFGEGQTYITTLTEGVSDTDNTTSAYTDPQAGADNTNRFTFTIAVPGGVSLGTVLTATATLSNMTSEFSENIVVTSPVTGTSVAGRVYLDTNFNATYDNGDTSTGLNNLYVKLFAAAGDAIAVVQVDQTTGNYTIPNVPAGTYSLVLSTSNAVADRTSILPANYVATEAPGGQRTNVVVVDNADPGAQNFGLFNGSILTGRVFNDNGAGGGTANDGSINGGEVGLASVAVKVTNAAGTVTYASATTSATGTYTLYIPASAGAVPIRIVETNPAFFVSTGATVGTTGGTYAIATDAITFTNTIGTSYSNVNFGDVAPTTFLAPGAKTTTPGNVALYTHTFTAGTSGSVTFTLDATPQPNAAGWQQMIYQDVNSNGVVDPGEPLIGGTGITAVPVAVTGGGVIKILVRDFVPATVTNGAKNSIIITATLDPTGTGAPNEVLTLTDVTSVGIATDLTLTKTVDKASALPGEVLTYVVTYTNGGTQPLTSLIVTDTTPAFTRFVSAAYGITPAGITNGTLTAPAVNARGALKWTFTGPLAPGATGTVTFQVRVDQ